MSLSKHQGLIATAVALAIHASAAQAEPMQIRFASPAPPNSPVTVGGLIPWAKDVSDASDGAIEVKVYAGPSIASFMNVYDRVINGVADAGFGLLAAFAAQFPKANVVALPFESDDAWKSGLAMWRLHISGVIADEFARVHALTMFTFPSGALHTRRPVRVLADMKGLKIATENRTAGEMVRLLGGAPISMPPNDYYPSIQRGVVDGAVMGWAAASTFKLEEVTTQHLEIPLGFTPGYVFMNRETYERLPDKGRRAIDRLSGEDFSKKLGVITTRPPIQWPGHEMARLPPEEGVRWKAALAPLTEAWLANTPDGPRVLAAYRVELAEVQSERDAPQGKN